MSLSRSSPPSWPRAFRLRLAEADPRGPLLRAALGRRAAGGAGARPRLADSWASWRCGCPGHLDRPQLVTWTAPGELRIDEFLRWGEPLDTGFTRTLAENLATLLPEHFVARLPWRATDVPRCRVVTELRVFGLQANGEVRLDGRWALLRTRGEQPLASGSVNLARGPLASGPNGVDAGAGVDAMSDLVAELSRTIADAIRALPDEPQDEPPSP